MYEINDYTHIYFIIGILSMILIFTIRTIGMFLSKDVKEVVNQPDKPKTNLLSIEEKNYFIQQVTQAYQMDRIDHIDQIIYRNKYYNGDDCMNAIKERYLIFKYGK